MGMVLGGGAWMEVQVCPKGGALWGWNQCHHQGLRDQNCLFFSHVRPQRKEAIYEAEPGS